MPFYAKTIGVRFLIITVQNLADLDHGDLYLGKSGPFLDPDSKSAIYILLDFSMIFATNGIHICFFLENFHSRKNEGFGIF